MKKPKLISKNGTSVLRMRLAKNESLSAREAEALSHGLVAGAFPAALSANKRALSFDVSGYSALAHFLKSGISENTFLEVLRDIFFTLKTLEENFFAIKAIILDTSYVFINHATGKIRFVFVPVQGFGSGRTTRGFYRALAKRAVFSGGDRPQFLEEYLEIVGRGVNMSMFELEELILRHTSEATPARLSARESAPPAASAAYDPLAQAAAIELSPSAPSPAPPPEGCTVFAPTAAAWLLHKRTGQRVEVAPPSLTIGKSESSGFKISDNPIISRSHAEIRVREGRFFLVDLFSTNKTYLDGAALAGGKEQELAFGDCFSVGNEEFELLVG